jgi:ribonuclease HI
VGLFVTWNMCRGVEQKAAALERLIRELGYPLFIALQEIGNADFTGNSNVAAVLTNPAAKYQYAAFSTHRIEKDGSTSTYDGAALLVRSDVKAVPWTWSEAADWSEHCESASALVFDPQDPTSPGFIVSSLYVHGASHDVAGFGKLLRSVRDNQMLLTDANAQLPGSRDGVIGTYFKERGELLDAFIVERGFMYPTPSGPTRVLGRRTITDDDGERITVDTGTINDHIVVGPEIFARLSSTDAESLVLSGDAWPSDHLPLVWSAEIGGAGSNDVKRFSRVAWHRVTDAQRQRFNARFTTLITAALRERRFDMIMIERALLDAARSTLPHVRPRDFNDGLFWTEAAREQVAAAGDGHADKTAAYAEVRRKTLAEHAEISPNDPASAWDFVRKYFSFKQEVSLKPPLIFVDDKGNPLDPAVDPAARVEGLAKCYASVSDNPPDIDAQADLAKLAATIPSPGATRGRAKWHRVGITELRTAVAALNTGRCADFLGVKAEHVRLLDDDSLTKIIPFVDRCLSRGAMPSHWLTAAVSPVPKRNRDLSLPKSWRPVSVTAICCRMLETILHNRISHRLEQHGGRTGSSQFGFRRGVSTATPLSGLSMFVKDGLQQSTTCPTWDGHDPSVRDSFARGTRTTDDSPEAPPRHVTLLVSIDGSDAFCRALPAKAVRKLLDMGCVNEARWIAAFLAGRSLTVREGGATSTSFPLQRGVPQGTILGPLLWSLVIDDLIVRCENKCKTPLAGCIAVPIFFADDINFAIRGFNPTSMVAQANQLLQIVREWATDNGVPMAKLQATWITGGKSVPDWAANWSATDGFITYDDKLHVLPSTQPMRLLGVIYDPLFNFHAHCDALVETCERLLRLLHAMSGVVSAEKMGLLYRGLILSRLRFAADAWYPFLRASDKNRLDSIHYRACCSITGLFEGCDEQATVYEATFRELQHEVFAETLKTADKLRRIPDGCADLTKSHQCFGVEWVARLFRDGVMPTAELRNPITASGAKQRRAPALWPSPDWVRPTAADAPHPDGADTLRDVGIRLSFGNPTDPRALHESLRPLARPHPFAPHELAIFDDQVRFITDSPGGLIKPDADYKEWPDELKQRFHDANAARMQQLSNQYGADATFGFTDGARDDKIRSCAGYYVVCNGPDPRPTSARIAAGHVKAGPIACVYTAELRSIEAALQAIIDLDDAGAFARRRNKNVVLVTDSRSSLESLRTTWIARIGFKEQEVLRKIWQLAARGFTIALAFVFSHVGGCDGNEWVDKQATAACKRYGATPCGDLWNVDTTRNMLHDYNGAVDAVVAAKAAARQHPSFRFAEMPADLRAAPSPPLPRGMPRYHEKLIYRARLGILTAVGGAIHGVDDNCALCGASDVVGRGGATIRHVVDCAREHLTPPLRFTIDSLWTDPVATACKLADISASAKQRIPTSSLRRASASCASSR